MPKIKYMFYIESAIPWVGKTGKMLGACINKLFKQHNIDLTREQFIVLKLLEQNDGIPLLDLVFITESNKTTLSRLIATMEKNNLVEKTTTEGDKRIKKIYLTPFGIKTINNTTPLVLHTIKKIEEGLTSNEINTTINTLKKIQTNINNFHN